METGYLSSRAGERKGKRQGRSKYPKRKKDQTKMFHHSYRSSRSSVICLAKQWRIKTLQAAVGRGRNRARRAKRRIEVWLTEERLLI